MKKKVIYHTSITLNEQDREKYDRLKHRWKIIEIFRRGLDFLLKNEDILMRQENENE